DRFPAGEEERDQRAPEGAQAARGGVPAPGGCCRGAQRRGGPWARCGRARAKPLATQGVRIGWRRRAPRAAQGLRDTGQGGARARALAPRGDHSGDRRGDGHQAELPLPRHAGVAEGRARAQGGPGLDGPRRRL
ncbi:MAG: hypothetical protein AVDCRST_MAG13-508, partial [uncultured Solirubrobacteraceae bacterium]